LFSSSSDAPWAIQAGLAIWWLTIEAADVPGRWVIIDRRFVLIDGDPA
jgi:hypothetical protein